MTILFQPFTHQPGVLFLLPGSTFVCQIFPARIVIFDYSVSPIVQVADIDPFDVAVGPLANFTVVSDLDKGYIQVSGISAIGFIRYRIYAAQSGWAIRPIKGPVTDKYHHRAVAAPRFERLHLGSFKKMRFSQMAERLDMAELLPLWYAFGQLVPKAVSGTIFSGDSLCQNLVSKQNVVEAFTELFCAGFDSLFVPRLYDSAFHGFELPVVCDSTVSPLLLLSKVAPLIRALYFTEQEQSFSFLPHLPGKFHCGSMTGITTSSGDCLDFVWSKHLIGTICFQPAITQERRFFFQKEIRECRLRMGKEKEGKVVSNGDVIFFEQGKRYFFDRFQK